jgi:cobalt/nickel transport system permease protein
LGGALLGATLGFAPAFALVAPVVVVQALLGDGGLLALGANLLNMAVVAPLVAAALAREGGPARRGVAAFVGTLAAVGACALELVLSGRGPAGALAGDLLLYHVPVAALEGFLAFAWVAYAAEAPALRRAPARAAALCAGGLACAALFAVSSPDGLEHVAEALGFAGLAR